MKNKAMSCSVFFTTLLMVFTITNAQARDLSGDEVTALFSDQTIFSYHEKKGFDIVTYYAPNGTFQMMRKDEKWPGLWRIDDKGHMCLTLKDPYSGVPKKERCRVITEDKGSYKKYTVKANGTRDLLISYSKFLKGNQEGL